MAKRLISGWLWLWFYLLQNGSAQRLRMSGSLTTIRSQLVRTINMLGSSSAGHKHVCISSPTWDNSCYTQLEDTSVIWTGVTDLTGNGERRTRPLPCVLLGVATTHQMSTYCGSGYVYITRSGLGIFGQKDARAPFPATSLQRQRTCTPWTRGPLPSTPSLSSELRVYRQNRPKVARTTVPAQATAQTPPTSRYSCNVLFLAQVH